MTSIKREAVKDADEFARAKMFFGEGAGVRRRLIQQTVQFKMANIPGYDEAFQRELAKQDFAKISRSVRRERRFIDAKEAVNKNGRAAVRGDYRSMSFPILLVIGAGYVAHELGADKAAIEYSKKEYRRAKLWIASKRSEWKHRHDPKVTELGATGPTAQGK